MIQLTVASARKVLKVFLNTDDQGKFVLSPPVVSDRPTAPMLHSSAKELIKCDLDFIKNILPRYLILPMDLDFQRQDS